MRQFEGQLLDEHDWSQVQPGVEVKLLAHPDLQGKEQYVIARSVDRAEKESAMLAQSKARLQAKLEQIDCFFEEKLVCQTWHHRAPHRSLDGAISRAERFYQVTIQQQGRDCQARNRLESEPIPRKPWP